MKIQRKTTLLTVVMLITTGILLSACTINTPVFSADQNEPVSAAEIIPDQSAEFDAETIEADLEETNFASEPDQSAEDIDSTSTSSLSPAEIDTLLFMREEEKLAHDVYIALYDLWGLQIFENIAGSEQTHTEAIKELLDKYNLPDPADTSPEGEFANPDLQQLYNELTEIGRASLSEALKVGAAIEEIDILDLQSALEETTNADIQRVYENLLKGSENHLRAFTNTLSRQIGETYRPQYLSQAEYDAILGGINAQGAGNARSGSRKP